MSYVDTLHRQTLERRLRFAQAAMRHLESKVQAEPPKPAPVALVAPAPLQVLDYVKARAGGPVRIERILAVVCQHFDMTNTALLSARRTANLIFPRHVLYYLCKQLTLNSLPSIGRRLGDRDHTTVLHGVRKIERRLEDGDPGLSDLIAELTLSIGGTDQTKQRNARIRLTAEQVSAIRASTEQAAKLAIRYGVTHGAIWHILKRNTWKDVE